MNWLELTSIQVLDDLVLLSQERPVVIFKHSTRCSISDIAKGRLERAGDQEGISFYYLDLLKYREISKAVSERFAVHHESPQVLLIRNGECIYDESHMGILMDEILNHSV